MEESFLKKNVRYSKRSVSFSKLLEKNSVLNFSGECSVILLKTFSSRKWNSMLQYRFRISGKATAFISIFPHKFYYYYYYY